jgi:hypothetical protein
MAILNQRQWRSLVGLGLAASCVSYADVTFRYKTEFHLASLPAALSQQAIQGLNTAMPPEIVIRLKAGKGLASWGGYTTVTDFERKEVTLVDTAGKRYATLPLERFSDELVHALPELPPQAKAGLSGMKSGFQSRMTGRTDSIHGIQAEEREMVMTMEMPPMPNLPAGPAMRLVMQFWTATPAEAVRNPAVHEMSGYNLWSNAMMNPAGAIEKMLQQMPGFGDNIAAMMKELRSGSAVLLRTHTEMYMPLIGALLKALPAGTPSPFGADFDPEKPFMQSNQEVADISTDPVADSVFVLPEGLKPAPVADIMKDLLAKMTPQQR